jgi:hypothetical protein
MISRYLLVLSSVTDVEGDALMAMAMAMAMAPTNRRMAE